MKRKFQPHIRPDNCFKISEIPKSILALGHYRSPESIQSVIKENPDMQLFYVVYDCSTRNSLKPIKDSDGKFLTILVCRN